MSKKIIFQKATRIEGNANIQVEVDRGTVKTARLLVQEFRGFEGFMRGIRVEYVPHMVSRICGLCSSAHQVASAKAIEEALGVRTPRSVSALREIQVLGEWINSHALSYFFLSMPDFVGSSGGIFHLIERRPEITREAFALRDAGLKIVRILGKRTSHPVTTGIGRFCAEPDENDLREIRTIAADVMERSLPLMRELGVLHLSAQRITFPADQQINFVAYDGDPEKDEFRVFDRSGNLRLRFGRGEFMDNISELRTEWTLAKFPYLTAYGFPAGIMLVGPLSRSFQENGFLYDRDFADLDLADMVRERSSLTLESYDACRLLEIYWAAKKILRLVDEVDLSQMHADVDFKASGQGIGVLEAPRGILLHRYLVNQGKIERMRLMVATQFNNAYINFLLRELAERHLEGDRISPEGERLIGRCVRIFDPCLSCATH